MPKEPYLYDQEVNAFQIEMPSNKGQNTTCYSTLENLQSSYLGVLLRSGCTSFAGGTAKLIFTLKPARNASEHDRATCELAATVATNDNTYLMLCQPSIEIDLASDVVDSLRVLQTPAQNYMPDSDQGQEVLRGYFTSDAATLLRPRISNAACRRYYCRRCAASEWRVDTTRQLRYG